jgi:hypothetical protein
VKKLLLLVPLAALAFASAAWAHDARPDCHGANEVPCRPDPQPTHGNDCTKSEDHRCCDSLELCPPVTTTTEPSTTSTSTPAPSGATTTTATRTTTMASVPITATPTTTATPSTTSTSTPTELPMTGAATTTLLFLGAWLILGGLAALLIGATIKAAR